MHLGVAIALMSLLAVSCSTRPVQQPRTVTQISEPRLDDSNHYFSQEDFHAVLAVAKQWIDGQRIYISLVYVSAPDTVRVYIRDWRGSESGTNYLDLKRAADGWKITREYTQEMRSFEG